MMSMKQETISHKIDLKQLAKGFGISESMVVEFLNDGRTFGRLGEFIYAEKTGATRAKSEGSPYDIDGLNGERIEIRSITNQISFASSKEVGYGRKVTEAGFSEKLNSVDYFVGIDFRNISNPTFVKITKDSIAKMGEVGILRKNKSVSANKFYNFLNKIGLVK